MNEKDKLQASTSVTINILFVVDSDPIVKYYTDNKITPSTKPEEPTQLPMTTTITDCLRMICDSPRGVLAGQGSHDLSFKAFTDDRVKFVGTSIEANSDSAVIVYGFKHMKGDEVFGKDAFKQKIIARNGAVMPSETATGVPPLQQRITFASYQAIVAKSGEENFELKFALYTLKGGEEQVLYGYFVWDPKITVS